MARIQQAMQWLSVAVLLLTTPQLTANKAQVLDIGALLDQAEQACAQQDSQRLQALSQQIRQLAQHPSLRGQAQYLEQLLKLFAAGHCQPLADSDSATANRKAQPISVSNQATTTRLVQFSVGYLDNVNQGSRHERITFNNPQTGLPIEGSLDSKSRPLSSPFVGVQGIYRVTSADGKITTQAGVSRQVYTDEADFNTTGVFVGKQQALANGAEGSAYLNVVRDDGGNMEARLGGVHYQPLGKASEQSKTGVLTSLEYLAYPEQKAYEAAVVNVALEHRQALAGGAEWGVRGRLGYDRALNNRPGGDRREVELSAQWKGAAVGKAWQPSVGARIAYRVDDQAFDPKLYGDSKRTQTRPRLELGLTKPLGKTHKLYASYQYGKTHDSELPLFDQPASNTVGVTLETSF